MISASLEDSTDWGNAFFYMIDRVRRALGVKKASAGNLAMLERLFMQAIDARTIGPKEGDVQGALAFGPIDKEVLGSDARAVIKILHDNYERIPSRPVFSVKFENDADSFKKVSAYILDIFQKQGGIAHNSVLGDVQLSKRGADDTVMHGYGKAKLASAWAIKDVIEQGVIVHTEKDYEGNGTDRHTIAARGYIGGKPAYMGVVVIAYPKQPAGTNPRFYLHETVIIGAKKETGSPSMPAPQLSVDTVEDPVSDTTVAQNAPDVNTQSMQEGAGISAQGALLSPESMEAVRNGTWREARAEGVDPNTNAEGATESPRLPDGQTPPFRQGGQSAADAANGADLSIDEAAVLDIAVRFYYKLRHPRHRVRSGRGCLCRGL